MKDLGDTPQRPGKEDLDPAIQRPVGHLEAGVGVSLGFQLLVGLVQELPEVGRHEVRAFG